jgi:hypothetical protein
MKKLSIMAIALFIVGGVLAQGAKVTTKKIAKKAVPNAVITSIETDYPDAVVEEFYAVPIKVYETQYKTTTSNTLEEGDAINHYRVLVKAKNVTKYMTFDKDGNFLQSREVIKDGKLPENVNAAIYKKYANWTIDATKEVVKTDIKGSDMLYRVGISNNGSKKRVLFINDKGVIKKDVARISVG